VAVSHDGAPGPGAVVARGLGAGVGPSAAAATVPEVANEAAIAKRAIARCKVEGKERSPEASELRNPSYMFARVCPLAEMVDRPAHPERRIRSAI